MNNKIHSAIPFIAGLFLFFASGFRAQITTDNYIIINSQGEKHDINAIVKASQTVDVVLFGEEHNDSVAHYMEFELFKRMHEIYKDKIMLSLEMFERESQVVLNEYLEGKIKENHFKKDARAWSNYRDYRPLIEYAKANNIKVIAANTSMRYASMAGRGTQAALLALSPEAKKWMAPLPYDTATGDYYNKLREIMGYNMHDNPGSSMMPGSLNGQSLWDATMAYSISEALNQNKGYKVLHLVGRFHVDEKFGICQQLTKYKKDVRFLVVTQLSDAAYPDINTSEHTKLGDFIIFSDPQVPKTYSGR
jgi:uncharacterized iron-regulated protein